MNVYHNNRTTQHSQTRLQSVSDKVLKILSIIADEIDLNIDSRKSHRRSNNSELKFRTKRQKDNENN
ncbi:CLUMA_CG011418, isoform A [Clunio marinus]|uniref:CLUMA_CG011418, isoform A n=1 Tax=Clunio marinus TaxID=568069 RepID=A0A1J1IHW6_9DIPT|nr:CLUMA_CG011418, isoform A [Clunio marinus]